MAKGRWQVRAPMAFVVTIAGLIILAQACGGGSAAEDVSPTATSPPAAATGSETPLPGSSFTFGAGPDGAGLVIGGASEEFAEFLGISLEELESELSAEGATPASVADAHDRTREELKTFFTEQQQAQLSEAVAAGNMSQEDADQALEDFASRIDDMIDGSMPFGGGPGTGGITITPGGGSAGLLIGGPSEELAEFLGIPLKQLESELSAEDATPASVADAHGHTREELKTFFTDQTEWQLIEAVAAGTMSQEDADQMLEDFASRIDGIIDGSVPFGGGPGAGGITRITPGGGSAGLLIGGPSEELAEFLGISLEQLESELSADGATPASVAEAHGRTREELKTFFTDQTEWQLIEAVAAGTMSQEDADSMMERFAAMIDDVIDGSMPSGGPRGAPSGQ